MKVQIVVGWLVVFIATFHANFSYRSLEPQAANNGPALYDIVAQPCKFSDAPTKCLRQRQLSICTDARTGDRPSRSVEPPVSEQLQAR